MERRQWVYLLAASFFMSLHLKSSKEKQTEEAALASGACLYLCYRGLGVVSLKTQLFCSRSLFYDAAQVCFVVVSARHYPQQDARVNY